MKLSNNIAIQDNVNKRFLFSPISALYIFFVFIEIITFVARTTFIFRNVCLMAIGTISIIYCLAIRGLKSIRPFFVFTTAYTFCGLISYFINRNADIQELLWPFAYMGVGLLLLNFKLSFKTARAIYLIVSFFFIFLIALNGGADNLVLQTSRNNISVYEIQLWSIYMISAYQNKQDVKIWTVFIGMLVSIIAIGRSGILTFIIIMGIFVHYSYSAGVSKRASFTKKIMYLIFLVVSILLVYYIYYDLIEQTLYNIVWRGIESKRVLIWKDYFSNASSSLNYFVFGAPQRGTFWLDKYADNLHNSFLELHAKYGIFMLGWVLITLLKRFIEYIKKRKMYLLIPLVGLLIRMNFDYTNFNGVLDIVLIYYLLSPYYCSYVRGIDK